MSCNRETLNITAGTDVILNVTLEHDGIVLNPALIDNLQANLVTGLGKRTPLEVTPSADYLVVKIPWVDGRLPGCCSLEITGSINGLAWSAVGKSIIRYTSATEIGPGTVDVTGDGYDVTMEVGYYYTDSPIEGVSATIDDGVGEPSVETSYIRRQLSFDFHNLKGNGITSIETDEHQGDEAINTVTIKTDLDDEGTDFHVRNGSRGNGIASSSEVMSPDDGGVNTHIFTDDDGNVHEFHTTNGRRGAQGESAVYNPDDPDAPDFVMANTTGDSTTKAMTQKAVTEELIVDNGIINPSKYNAYSYYINASGQWAQPANPDAAKSISIPVTSREAIEITTNNSYGCYIAFLRTDNHTTSTTPDYAGGAVNKTILEKSTTTLLVPPSDATVLCLTIKHINDFTPSLIKKYALVKESVERLNDEVGDLLVATDTAVTTWANKSISSSGYGISTTNQCSNELVFDVDEVKEVSVTPPNNKTAFALYNIRKVDGQDVFSTAMTYDDEHADGGFIPYPYSFAFTPLEGRRYVVRIKGMPNGTAAELSALTDSDKPIVTMTLNETRVDKLEDDVSELKHKSYSYLRNYSNITGLLTFESKAISTSGIVDSGTSLLAKIPNCGCIEVRMNRPAGGFSVWKKTGSTITQLYAYDYYQYRYVGDYSSEYYVMLQPEAGVAVSPSNVSVYTYGDIGDITNFNLPSWARGKKLAFFGDSIVQGRYPKNSQSVNICMDKPWPNLVSQALGSMDMMNFAIGGALVCTSDWKALVANVGKITGYDVVFVCAGTNDVSGRKSLASFTTDYTTIVQTLKANNSKVVCITPCTRTASVTSPNMTMAQACTAIETISSNEQVDCINLNSLTATDEFKSHLVDGIHPDEIGQRIIADIILNSIA